MKLKYWTTTEIRFLRENLQMPYKEIAEKLGRTTLSIRKKVSTLGIKKTFPWNTEHVDLLLKMRRENRTWREIGAAIGCGESPAKNMLHRLKKWQKVGQRKTN